jgi:carbonic anhydrase
MSTVWGESVVLDPGYRSALIEVAVALNAALTAAMLQDEFASTSASSLGVLFGVYDLATRRVGVPLKDAVDRDVHLIGPPRDRDSFKQLGAQVAGSDFVRRRLTTGHR